MAKNHVSNFGDLPFLLILIFLWISVSDAVNFCDPLRTNGWRRRLWFPIHPRQFNIVPTMEYYDKQQYPNLVLLCPDQSSGVSISQSDAELLLTTCRSVIVKWVWSSLLTPLPTRLLPSSRYERI